MIKSPVFMMLIGLPGSGKSTYAEKYKDHFNIHSSDKLREEMFGDVNTNSKESNAKLFPELHRRIKADLKAGNNVIYDATNIKQRLRRAFLLEIKNIPCLKRCIVIATPYYVCLRNNQNRARNVPEFVIRDMYTHFQPPHESEGWDEIEVVYEANAADYAPYTLSYLYNPASGIDYLSQCNEHHDLTLGKHCRAAAEYISKLKNDDHALVFAALIHDVGKIFTMAKGNDGNCHFYQHQCVGAYDSYFYSLNEGSFSMEDIVRIANLIYFHMEPYSWGQGQALIHKRLSQLGTKLFRDIERLHMADMVAH